MMTLRPRGLAFSRDGRVLVATERDHVLALDTRTDQVHVLPVAAVSAIAFADQIWTASTGAPTLARWRFDGTPIDGPVALPGDAGQLVAAPVGAAAALWTGAPGCALLDERGLRQVPAPRADVVVPLTGRRWVTATGARVVAPSGLSCELPAGTRVSAGTVVLDGAAVLVVGERAGGRELAVVGLTNGKLQLRQPIANVPELHVAARAAVVVMRTDARTIVALDLRSGRVLGQHEAAAELLEVAIDPDAHRLALRDADGHLAVLALADALAARAQVAVAEPESAPAVATGASPPPALPVAEAAAPVSSLFARPLQLRALAPRTSVVEVDRARALELLDLETRSIALRVLRAIAAAWDTRRLGYGNEGSHPFEHEVAALLGMNGGFAEDYLQAADTHLREHTAAIAAIDPRGPGTPIGALAIELGLSSLAVDILLVIAAPALWSEAARLYGILANDGARPLVDEALVAQILGPLASRHELAAELGPRAPLVMLGLVEVDPSRPRPFAALTIDPVVLARLRCEEVDLGAGLVVRGSDRSLEELAIAPGVIEDALLAFVRAQGPGRIALRGRPGSGRRTLLAALAAEAGRPLGVLDAALMPRTERELVFAVRGALRRAQLAGLLPCIVNLETIAFAERSGREVVVEILRAHPGPLAVVLPPNEAPPLDAGHISIELPVLPEGERLRVWSGALADAGLVVADRDALAAKYRVGPGVIHRAVAAIRDRPRTRDLDATAELDDFIRQTRDARLGAYARRVERLAAWDQLVLPPDVLDSLQELVARVRHRRTVFEAWGMEQTMSTSRGLTALFSGPPGTGKTLVAGVIARELGLDLYQVDLSKVMSKWLGETERNLAAIFDAAEDGQVILLFDEADSLFAKRTEVRSSNDRYANLEVNYLLQRLDTFEGIAVLTTNASGSIDPAFKRRLSFRLSFPFPDEETREELWRAHLPPTLPTAGDLAFDKLAHKYQLSGGYIRNACLRAAFLAARDASPLTQHHLERAVALEFAELGKLSSSGALD